jgi:hypothetical protein
MAAEQFMSIVMEPQIIDFPSTIWVKHFWIVRLTLIQFRITLEDEEPPPHPNKECLLSFQLVVLPPA